MEFTQSDRDMLKANDLKLKTLCTTTGNMHSTLKAIDDKLGDNAVACATTRAKCREEINDKFVRIRTFWSVITVIILGFLAKVFFIK